LDDVCLVDTDVAASDDFYRELLGFERRMRNVRFADFVFDSGPRLAMWMRPSIAETVGAAYPEAPGLPFRLTVEVPEPAARAAADRVPGARTLPDGRVAVTDPDGFGTVLAPTGDERSRIAGVELVVSDPERTAAFLGQLGFRRDGLVFDGGEATITLVDRTDPVALDDGFGRGGGHLMLAVELETGDQVDALYAELVSRGLAASGPPAVFEWGARSTYFVDPDGYVWEIYAWVEEPR
jgi:catechol 2,3-dioxygenase-like lactoylglutathione lyase family enzyme